MFNPASLLGIPQGIFKSIYGAGMRREGEALEDSAEFTPYQMPDQINEALSIYDTQRLNQGLPGQGVIMDRIGGNAANTINQVNRYGGGGAEMMAAIAGTNANADASMVDLGIAAANLQRQDEANYANMLGTVADYKDKEWEINQYIPYQQQLETARRMQEAGAENINQGMGDIFGSASAAFIPGGDATFKAISGADNATRAQATQAATQSAAATPLNLSYLSPPSTSPTFIQNQAQQDALKQHMELMDFLVSNKNYVAGPKSGVPSVFDYKQYLR